jgi:hypothetical protein
MGVKGGVSVASHKHRALPKRAKERGWVICVTPDECAANPQRQDAHGNRTRLDTCSCGATRLAEFNGGRTNYGPWREVEGEEHGSNDA